MHKLAIHDCPTIFSIGVFRLHCILDGRNNHPAQGGGLTCQGNIRGGACKSARTSITEVSPAKQRGRCKTTCLSICKLANALLTSAVF